MMLFKKLLLIITALWVLSVSALANIQTTALPLPDKSFQTACKVISDPQEITPESLNRILRLLNRNHFELSNSQTETAWNLYAKHADALLGIERNKNGVPARLLDNTSGGINRTAVLHALFKLMPPDRVRALPAAAYFPGSVPDSVKPVRRRFTLDTTQTRWHSTGLYAGPGALITVTCPESAVNAKLKVRIGCHKDNLTRKEKAWRWPIITLEKPIIAQTTPIASPFGGPIYLVVPNDAKPEQIFNITVSGAVEMPHFILGKTSVSQWQKIKNNPAPWAELEAEKIVLTIPSNVIRDYQDPTKALQFWQDVADAQDDLSGRIPPRYKERFVCDIQIFAGSLHSGYPIMGHQKGAAGLIDYKKLSTEGTWGWFHELGHNHQRSVWSKPGEVTVNIFSMYSMETVVGLDTEEVGWYKKCSKAVKDFYATGNKSGSNPAFEDGYALPLAMYMHLRKAFGWDFYKETFREFERVKSDWPKDQQARRDLWLTITSKAADKNLTAFYDRWEFSTTEKARSQVAHLPAWNPKEYPDS